MKYKYFVSFAHRLGFGNMEIDSNSLLDNMAVIKFTQETIKKNKGGDDVVIIAFQLLSTANS